MHKYEAIVLKLQEKGIVFDCAMSEREMIDLEKLYNISFPLELKNLFAIGVPISKGFYNWRDTSLENTRFIYNVLAMPFQGLQFDLENGDFWCENWGVRPDKIEEAQSVLTKLYNKAPKLIPIFSHRYMPFIPENANVPVFSIMQSDVIHYGMDLISYLEIEFGYRQYEDIMQASFQHIDFWSDLL